MDNSEHYKDAGEDEAPTPQEVVEDFYQGKPGDGVTTPFEPWGDEDQFEQAKKALKAAEGWASADEKLHRDVSVLLSGLGERAKEKLATGGIVNPPRGYDEDYTLIDEVPEEFWSPEPQLTDKGQQFLEKLDAALEENEAPDSLAEEYGCLCTGATGTHDLDCPLRKTKLWKKQELADLGTISVERGGVVFPPRRPHWLEPYYTINRLGWRRWELRWGLDHRGDSTTIMFKTRKAAEGAARFMDLATSTYWHVFVTYGMKHERRQR